jgi:Leucine-rich repeat (LRR) protein
MASPHRPGTTKKVFKLTINNMDHREMNTTLERFLEEGRRADGGVWTIPFRALSIQIWPEREEMDLFYSQPRIAEFLATYGPQISHLKIPYLFVHVQGFHVEREEIELRHELSFYEGLPNLTHLTTCNLGNNAPTELPFLQRLHSLQIGWVRVNYYSNRNATDFLSNCHNLTQLTLPEAFMPALPAYFETRTRREHPWTLNFTFQPDPLMGEIQSYIRSEDGARLLDALAAADGRILISSNLPSMILDNAVFHFRGQPEKLRKFGKAITKLWGFSTSLSRVDLPNLRRLRIHPNSVSAESVEEVEEFLKKREDPWPKLRLISIRNVDCFPGSNRSDIGRLLVGRRRVRPSVQELRFYLQLTFLSSEEALRNLPNLSILVLEVNEESLRVFRNCIRSLPTNSPNIKSLDIRFQCLLRVEDQEGLAPLLAFPGKINCELPFIPYFVAYFIYIYILICGSNFFSLEVVGYNG